MEHILAMCHTRTAVPPLLDGTLKKHAIIEMEECTIKRLDDVEGTYCSVVFKVTALDQQANQIGEPKRMMRDPLKTLPSESDRGTNEYDERPSKTSTTQGANTSR